MQTWTKVAPTDRSWKDHTVPTGLLCAEILEDLRNRGCAVDDIDARTADEAYIDFGGPIHTSRKYWTADLGDGYKLSIGYDHIDVMVSALKELPERRTPHGVPYYKLHSWLWCTVLTPQMRDRLLTAVQEHRVHIDAEVAAYDQRIARRW